MVCTNPDLIVDRGEVREYCAGSIAKVFEKIGGNVKYFGKPSSISIRIPNMKNEPEKFSENFRKVRKCLSLKSSL